MRFDRTGSVRGRIDRPTHGVPMGSLNDWLVPGMKLSQVINGDRDIVAGEFAGDEWFDAVPAAPARPVRIQACECQR